MKTNKHSTTSITITKQPTTGNTGLKMGSEVPTHLSRICDVCHQGNGISKRRQVVSVPRRPLPREKRLYGTVTNDHRNVSYLQGTAGAFSVIRGHKTFK